MLIKLQMQEDFRLKVFMAVVKELNFTKAASVLDISQPAVSQNIRDLESSLGTSLFIRSHGKLEITPAGRILQYYACRILDEYSSLNSAFAKKSIDSGGLRIFFPSVSREIFAGEVISIINILHPELEVSLSDDMAAADIVVIETQDRKKKDTGIVVDVHVFPENHPMSGLVCQAIELSRYGDVI